MPKKLITHSEDFHTDDVFATALLLELFPDSEVVRTRDESVIATGDIVYDVGKLYDASKGRFDHHQLEAGKRSNGIVYSAFGLLWKEYGVQFCDGNPTVAQKIDEKLVTPIDANDNGQRITTSMFEDVRPFTIDDVIRNLNPLHWQDIPEDYDKQFDQAVELARAVLRRLKATTQDMLASQTAVLDAYANASDKRLLVMDKVGASVSDIVEQLPELLYLVSPRPNGAWGVLALAAQPGSFETRRPFPEAWRGKPAAELPAITGVSDATFVHTTGFYAVATTREGALALAQKALE